MIIGLEQGKQSTNTAEATNPLGKILGKTKKVFAKLELKYKGGRNDDEKKSVLIDIDDLHVFAIQGNNLIYLLLLLHIMCMYMPHNKYVLDGISVITTLGNAAFTK